MLVLFPSPPEAVERQSAAAWGTLSEARAPSVALFAADGADGAVGGTPMRALLGRAQPKGLGQQAHAEADTADEQGGEDLELSSVYRTLYAVVALARSHKQACGVRGAWHSLGAPRSSPRVATPLAAHPECRGAALVLLMRWKTR